MVETSFPYRPHLSRRSSLLLVLLAAPLYLYANLFAGRIPYFMLGDQRFFWLYAQRMMNSEQVYRDFFQFTPPGTDLVYLTFFRIFGLHAWVMNLVILLLGVLLCVLCFYLAQRIMPPRYALLASLLFLTLVYGKLLDATHHWFSLFAVMCAAGVLTPSRTTTRVVIAGAFLALASFFTQTAGAAGAIALIAALAWEHASVNKPWRAILVQQLLLLVSVALIWSALSARFVAAAGWPQFRFLLVTYPLRYIVGEHQFLVPDLTELFTRHTISTIAQRLFVYLVLIAIYPAVLWHCWHKRRRDMPLVLLSLSGLSLLLEVITRTTWIRLYAVSMPAIILLVWFVNSHQKLRRYAVPALWLLIVALAAVQIRTRRNTPAQPMGLRAGRVFVPPQYADEFLWLMQHTVPGETLFPASRVDLCPLLDLRSPAYVDILWPATPEYLALTLEQLEQKQVRHIFATPYWTAAPQTPAGRPHDPFAPFRNYLTSHYTRIQIFSNHDEIWERRTPIPQPAASAR